MIGGKTIYHSHHFKMIKVALLYPANKYISYGFQKLLKQTIDYLNSSQIQVLLCIKRRGSVPLNTIYQPKTHRSIQVFYYLSSDELSKEINARDIKVILSLDYRYPKLKTRARIINTVQNMEPLINQYYGSISEKVLMTCLKIRVKYFVRRADATLCLSRYTEKWVSDHFPGKQTYVNYLGADDTVVKDVRIENPKVVSILSANKKIVFSAGSICPARGIEDLIYAASHLLKSRTDFYVAFAGKQTERQARYRRKLKNRISRLGLDNKFIWLGNCNEAEMRELYKNSAVFVMTSRVEACPNVLLEAMQSGCKIVSNRVEPMTEILGDAGCYYEQGNYLELSTTINNQLYNPDVKVKNASVERASRLTWEQWGHNILNMLETECAHFLATPTS